MSWMRLQKSLLFLCFISYFVPTAEIQPLEDVHSQLSPYLVLLAVIFHLGLASPKQQRLGHTSLPFSLPAHNITSAPPGTQLEPDYSQDLAQILHPTQFQSVKFSFKPGCRGVSSRETRKTSAFNPEGFAHLCRRAVELLQAVLQSLHFCF